MIHGSGPVTVSLRRMHAAAVLEMGWCTECKDFTTTKVGVDDTDIKCAKCGVCCVHGAVTALSRGLVQIP